MPGASRPTSRYDYLDRNRRQAGSVLAVDAGDAVVFINYYEPASEAEREGVATRATTFFAQIEVR